MDCVRIKAPAKINLMLDVLDRRPDGYHDIVSVMQTVSLFDELTVRKKKSPGTEIRCDADGVPEGPGNTVYTACSLFLEKAGIRDGVEIEIVKHIPVQAGLAGGSTDAAAVLRALDAMYGHPLAREELFSIGAITGSDVPFCMTGGTALCTGRGEKVLPLEPLKPCGIVIIKPPEGVSTKEAYRALDEAPLRRHCDTDAVMEALLSGDLKKLARVTVNSFQEHAVKGAGSIGDVLGILSAAGADMCLMSGSGPAVFGTFGNTDDALKAASEAGKNREYAVFAAKPVPVLPEPEFQTGSLRR